MHNHAPPNYDCPLCQGIRKDKPDSEFEIVFSDDEIFVIVNPKWWPNNPGALLIAPNRHYENIYDLPPELGTPMQRAARWGAIAMKAAYHCDGTSTRQHNEPYGNQDVWHYHLHVFPRWKGDALYESHGAFVDQQLIRQRTTQLRAVWPSE